MFNIEDDIHSESGLEISSIHITTSSQSDIPKGSSIDIVASEMLFSVVSTAHTMLR